MPQYHGPSVRELEIQVLDAEVATKAILDTPKLQPASVARLVALDEAIITELRTLEEAGEASSPEADRLRQLHDRMLETLRSISAEP